MLKLTEWGNAYAKESSWKDFALVKFCLCALGVMIGVSIPQKGKKWGFLTAYFVFIATYFPLMGKLVRIVREGRADEEK